MYTNDNRTFELDNITDEFTDLITDNNILSDNDDILSGAVPKHNTKTIVTINGNLYYFVKLPHKVYIHLYMCMYTSHYYQAVLPVCLASNTIWLVIVHLYLLFVW